MAVQGSVPSITLCFTSTQNSSSSSGGSIHSSDLKGTRHTCGAQTDVWQTFMHTKLKNKITQKGKSAILLYIAYVTVPFRSITSVNCTDEISLCLHGSHHNMQSLSTSPSRFSQARLATFEQL